MMMTREEFWERTQAILDARGDPLADPLLWVYLEENTDDLEALVALCAGLSILKQVAPPERTRRTGIRVAAGIAALFVLLLLGRGMPAFSPEPVNRMLSCKMEISEEKVDEIIIRCFDGKDWRISIESRVLPKPGREISRVACRVHEKTQPLPISRTY